MRISTANFYSSGLAGIENTQSQMAKLSEQMSTGRKILTPADDPVASAQILEVTQAQDMNTQYQTNGASATSAISMTDSSLSSLVNLVNSVKSLALQAGDPTLTLTDRQAIATQVQASYQDLIGLANGTDGNGQYLYSGFLGSTKPFSETSPGVVTYNGSQDQRKIQISDSQNIAVSNSGTQVFQSIKQGNGTFVTAPATAPLNTGSGVVDLGNVTNSAAWAASDRNFTIRFAVSAATPPVTTYDIVDNVTGNSALTGLAAAATGPYSRTYQTGSTINLKSQGAEPAFDYGGSVSISGAPATGDTFTVKPSTDQQMFDTFTQLQTTLNSGKGTPAQSAQYQNSLNLVIQNLDNALANIGSVQADVGTRLAQVDTTQTALGDASLQYSTQLNTLGGLDYAKAISDFTLAKTALDASQKTYAQIAGLSLFNQIQ